VLMPETGTGKAVYTAWSQTRWQRPKEP